MKSTNIKSWTIKGKTQNGNSLKTDIEAETKEDATKLFLEENEDYSIVYVRPSGRYSYSTTGYGIFSLLGYYYASGRIEVYDREDGGGYAIDEGSYWVPLKDEGKVRDFFDDLETTDPLYIKIGNFEACQKAVSDETGIPVDKLNDREEVRKFGDKRHQEYLDSLSKEDKEYFENKFGEIKDVRNS